MYINKIINPLTIRIMKIILNQEVLTNKLELKIIKIKLKINNIIFCIGRLVSIKEFKIK